jgi:hypothetical protein
MKSVLKKIHLCLLFFGFSILNNLYSQETLYMPLNIKKAYAQGTRSQDGRPGDRYWQNRSDYKINVELDTKEKSVRGNAKIKYYNQSPDSLKTLMVRLYQDIFKKGMMRDFPLDTADIHNGTAISYLTVDGDTLSMIKSDKQILRLGTNMQIKLTKPLAPTKNCDITIGWSARLPSVRHLRMGAYGDSAFFVAYWYPQIAVYDDIDGWDIFSYTGTQEFYNDFCDYDVAITVPGDYLVWATGLLQNAEAVLTDTYLRRYKSAFKSDSIINIVTETDYERGEITTQKKKNTWKFKASNVTDFTFAASNCYLWDGASLFVDENKSRRIMVDAAYRKNSKDFYQVAQIGRDVIAYFSFELPAIAFPYPKLTVFNGSGGMEFPMMVNDGTTTKMARTIGLTSHEIAHTYFPFYMGINEKKYAWMDEGWAVMLPSDFQNRMVEGSGQINREVRRYNGIGGNEFDLPVMIPSVMLRGSAYRTAAYGRSSLAYFALRDLIGDELFKKALQSFINRWNGKHPIPYDFFYTFNNVYGESLNWFWKAWFFDKNYADLAIDAVNLKENEIEIVIRNNGGSVVNKRSQRISKRARSTGGNMEKWFCDGYFDF